MLIGGAVYILLLTILLGRSVALDEYMLGGPPGLERRLWMLVHLGRAVVFGAPAILMLWLWWRPWGGVVGLAAVIVLSVIFAVIWRADYRRTPVHRARRKWFVNATRALLGIYILQLMAAAIVFLLPARLPPADGQAETPARAAAREEVGLSAHVIPVVGIWSMMDPDAYARALRAAGEARTGAEAVEPPPATAPGS